MKPVTALPLKPKYQKASGLMVFDIETPLPLPTGFECHETTAVYLPAGKIAGNHKHPRREVYICFEKDVCLLWLDESGNTHTQAMHNPGQSPQMFILPPMVPHAVANRSNKGITLIGYADGPLEGVEDVDVVT